MVLVRIYKIWSELGNMVYIGSTENELKIRFTKHKSKFKLGTIKETSKYLFEEYGVENCQISEICAVLCETKDIRKKLEASYIKHWRERQEYKCVNICTPGRGDAEYYQDNKEHLKQIVKEYQTKNKEIIYKWKQTENCCNICGGHYINTHKARHLKTIKHQNAIIQT